MFSASQVSTFELCERKWGWTYLENLRPAPHPSAALGTEIHTYLQESVETRYWNTADPAWPIIAPARKFLQSIPDDSETESYFELELGRHKFRGYKDVQWLRDGIPCVVDHKSTGYLGYAKEPEDLKCDVQATLYALDAMQRYYTGEPGPVDLVWSYYRTKDGPATKLTKLRVYPKDIEPRINKTIETADKMQAAIDAGHRAGDMTPDWDACFAFGGCPFRDHCEQEEIAKGTGINVNEKRKALLDMLNNKLGGAPSVPDREETPQATPESASMAPAINPPDDEALVIGTDPAGPSAPPNDNPRMSPDGERLDPLPALAPKGQVKRKKSTLYVNCLPLSGKMPASASTLFVKATAQLGISHYKLAEFGKGPGQFATALRNVIEAEGGLPPELYLWTGTSEGRDAYEVLVSYADSVIIGVPT